MHSLGLKFGLYVTPGSSDQAVAQNTSIEGTLVLSVDQDAVDAARIASTSTDQAFAKTEKGGDVVVGLCNPGSEPAVVSTTAAAIGLPASDAYQLNNLWTNHVKESGPVLPARWCSAA